MDAPVAVDDHDGVRGGFEEVAELALGCAFNSQLRDRRLGTLALGEIEDERNGFAGTPFEYRGPDQDRNASSVLAEIFQLMRAHEARSAELLGGEEVRFLPLGRRQVAPADLPG